MSILNNQKKTRQISQAVKPRMKSHLNGIVSLFSLQNKYIEHRSA